MRPHFRLVTFNIRCGVADDGPNSWPHRRDAFTNKVLDLDPDILCLQEALFFQLEDIQRACQDYDCYAVGREDGVRQGESCAILWKRDRASKADAGTLWLSDTPDVPASATWGNEITRICSWVDLALEGDLLLRVWNTHWDHISGDSRARSGEMLVQLVTESDKAAIVAGDFNEERRATGRALLEIALEDLTPFEEPTYHGFGTMEGAGNIDGVYGTEEVQLLDSAIDQEQIFNRWPSDHHPLWVDFTLARHPHELLDL